MASKFTVRSLQSLARSRKTCTCSIEHSTSSISRQFSTTVRRAEEVEAVEERPRWSFTPPAMKAPFQPRIKDPTKSWEVNEDPAKVDAVYVNMFGRGGDKVLSDEIKWLALTHKSFDQGRRGFNDRLAFLGKRLLILQANIALLHAPSPSTPHDFRGRKTFSHPALDGLSNLSSTSVTEAFSKERISQLARSYGIGEVTRWKPRIPKNLESSGCDVVYATSLYAIIGAVALQRGGKKANEVARELVLKPLGL